MEILFVLLGLAVGVVIGILYRVGDAETANAADAPGL